MSNETPKQSALQPVEEVQAEQTMKIITVTTDGLQRDIVETTLCYSNHTTDKKSVPIKAVMMKFTDERIKEFMPSKVWYDRTSNAHNFNVLFYVNPTMPQKVRPFRENTYLLFFIPQKNDVIEYDCNIRLFMDQVLTLENQMAYVIMVGEDEIGQIVANDETIRKEVELRPDEVAIVELYKS